MSNLRGLIPGSGDDPRYQRRFRFRRCKPTLLNCLQQSVADIHLPVIVLGEYRYCVKSSRLPLLARCWLEELESSAIVVAVTSETSRIYGDIRYELRVAGQPIPEDDLWIAALARQHGLPILTNDPHFDQVSGLHPFAFILQGARSRPYYEHGGFPGHVTAPHANLCCAEP